MPGMERPPAALLIFIVIFFILAPDAPRPNTPHQQDEHNLLLANERHALQVLNTSHYGDFDPPAKKWLNISGLREEDGYAWDQLHKVRARVLEHTENILAPWRSHDLDGRYKDVAALDGNVQALRSPSSGQSKVAVPFYQNITGIVRGKWIRSKLSADIPLPSLNLTKLSPRVSYITQDYDRNITGEEGELSIKFDERKSALLEKGAREVKAELAIKDETSIGDGWEMTLHGVHFPESGSVLLATTGDKFEGIFALPHLARSEASFLLAQELLNTTISTTIKKHQNTLTAGPSYPWGSSPGDPAEVMFPIPHCEFVVYAQQNIIWPHSAYPPYKGDSGSPTYLERLEDELRFPTGAPMQDVRNMEFSTVIFSPDCGFVLESKGPPDFSPAIATHLRGPKAESFYKSVRVLVQALSGLLALQIYLLIRQMKDTSTPSTRSRISFYTIAMMALGDGFTFFSFMAAGMLSDTVFLISAGTSFLAFMSVSFFGMKFLIDIWTVQAPERLERERQRERARQERSASQPAPSTTTALNAVNPGVGNTQSPDSLPLPATARRPNDTGATPIIVPSDGDIDAEIAEVTNAPPTTTQTTMGTTRRETGAMYSRFYFLLLGIIFLSLNATTWPTSLRNLYSNFLACTYLSFWTPQIRRNIMRNCRKALRWEFVVGQSILRFIPIFYFYTYEDNVFGFHADRTSMWALVGWLWLQVWVLVSQEILGPRFFVPTGWAPPAYDYHPVLKEDDEENGARMPIGFTMATTDGDMKATTPGESKEHGRKVFDCAICMQDIDVPIIAAATAEGDSSGGAALGKNLFSRRAYMVTPCRHIFHSPCLEGWMRYKLQCPICRETLPPL